MTFRIYTENFPNIPEITSRYFDGFTVIHGKGYWKGKLEETAIIEVITSGEQDREVIFQLAEEIKSKNRQEVVLMSQTSGEEVFI